MVFGLFKDRPQSSPEGGRNLESSYRGSHESTVKRIQYRERRKFSLKKTLLIVAGLGIGLYFAGPWLAGLWGDGSKKSARTGLAWNARFNKTLPRGTNVTPPKSKGYGYGGPPVV